MAEKIGIVGAGAWGTALALLLADKGHDVQLWMHERDLAEETRRTHDNRVYLPGFTLPANISVTSNLEEAVRERPFILSVAPSHTVREVSTRMAPFLADTAIIVSASKGIEIDTLMPLSDVLRQTLPPAFHARLCFLSGPSFAREVSLKMPTAVALASYEPEAAKAAQQLMSTSYFRVYTNPERHRRGANLCGLGTG